ncbi:MAG: hypothetical protein AAB496_01765 [Patescibacteria group bacterium]
MDSTSLQANQSSNAPVNNPPNYNKIPRDSIKDVFASLLSITIFYWMVYLFFNWAFRIGDGSGISILPQQGSNSHQFLLVPIGVFLSFGLVSLVRKLVHSGKKLLAIISLLIPVLFTIFAFVLFIIFPCEGQFCGFGFAIFIMVVLMLAAGAYISLVITTISIYFVRKYKYGFTTLIILFIFLLVMPTAYAFFTTLSFNNKISDKEAPIYRVTLQKIQINKQDYDSVDKLKHCCTVLEVKQAGTVVMARLSASELLLQGPVSRSQDSYSQTVYKTSLLVENDKKIIDVGKGVNFSAFSISPSAGSGTRPIFLSIPKRMIAFFEEYRDGGDFIVTRLDGAGIYIDENFCPWSCSVEWGEDGFIYLTVSQQDQSEVYYKVTPP